jgi:RNA polymerase-binding transcription factor DksA
MSTTLQPGSTKRLPPNPCAASGAEKRDAPSSLPDSPRPVNESEGELHAAEQAVAEALPDFESRRGAVLEAPVQQINEALDRWAIGLYGRCRECGDQIELWRLSADPSASLCYECQTGIEIDHRWRRSDKNRAGTRLLE